MTSPPPVPVPPSQSAPDGSRLEQRQTHKPGSPSADSPTAGGVFAELSPPYSTIVADPPWRYDSTGILTSARTAATAPDADRRYTTMTPGQVAALPVADLAATDAHLYLWVTNPMLPHGFGVLAAWGFRYVTTITWHKRGRLGMGFYWRGQTEHLLFAVRGDLPIPADRRERNHFEAPATGHSRKPGSVLDAIERVSPAPYVELFCRQPRFGWDSWGWGYELGEAS